MTIAEPWLGSAVILTEWSHKEEESENIMECSENVEPVMLEKDER